MIEFLTLQETRVKACSFDITALCCLLDIAYTISHARLAKVQSTTIADNSITYRARRVSACIKQKGVYFILFDCTAY